VCPSFEIHIQPRTVYGLIPEERAVDEASEWAGVLSFPREIVVNSDDSLSFFPAQEVSLLRTGATTCLNNPGKTDLSSSCF
jgi:sucrose-6-phosphate hydrolase SacC (GH32 family)